MDPVRNPFAPGAGTQPPELVGRSELLEAARIAIARIRLGNPAKSMMLIGLRGVGKTVLLIRIKEEADSTGIQTLRIEAKEKGSLPAILAPQLRQALLRLSRNANAKDLAQRALRGLAGFAKALKVKYGDIEVGFDFEPEPGLADNGDLEHDLQALMEAAGQAAAQADTAMAIFIDELQYVEEKQLAALITAMHNCAQSRLPVILIGAGLPQLAGRMGEAKSYAERLFDFPTIGPLSSADARTAIEAPANHQNVEVEDKAIELIIDQTKGYPYFIQEWGKHAWDAADRSPITADDVRAASITAVAALDGSFFRVRFDRLTPAEKVYLRAMAELGPGPHRSGDIAQLLNMEVTALGPRRNNLIAKGMIWSPSHGDTAFTVPLFDQFMKRVIPGSDWLTR
ncbi:MAG TPA: AAA family ATPase [Flavobacteriales bacterium]|nr:AAA family ATPase [Flavobacteriales bacterium]